MQIAVYGNNSLGTLAESIQSFQNGTTQMRIGTINSAVLQIFRFLPTLNGADIDTMEAALEEGTEFRELIDTEVQKDHGRLLGNLPIMYRWVTSEYPIRTPEDAKKIRMRTVGVRIEEDYWRTMGMESESFPVEQVYSALQLGYVNAQENTIPSIISNRIYEQQKYAINLRHRVYMDQIFVNENFYQELTEEQQTWLCEAAEETVDYISGQAENYENQGLQQFKEAGLTVIELTEEERESLLSSVREYTYNSYVESCGKELVDRVMDLVH